MLTLRFNTSLPFLVAFFTADLTTHRTVLEQLSRCTKIPQKLLSRLLTFPFLRFQKVLSHEHHLICNSMTMLVTCLIQIYGK